ncbi:MAG TPA: hypothetical protein VJB90_04590, partial [Candidatus Nanoarchaeia archaeon]|nr:hypothetical protein [Candidatus Nanoarchaeia archaeon]
MKGGIDGLTEAYSGSGATLSPERFTVQMLKGEHGSWDHGMYTPWRVIEGTIFAVPVWGFGDDIDSKVVFAPDMFRHEAYMYRKTRDETRTAKGVPGLQLRELEYKQPRPKGRGILRTKNMRKRDATEVVYSENLWRPKSPQPKGRGFKF